VLTSSRVTGSMTHAARLAALCAAHGVRELWTADQDFSRFAALRVRNPLID
jgi:predicted nucleic acid-binding protein